MLGKQFCGFQLEVGISYDLIRDRDDGLSPFDLLIDLFGRDALVGQPLELRKKVVVQITKLVSHGSRSLLLRQPLFGGGNPIAEGTLQSARAGRAYPAHGDTVVLGSLRDLGAVGGGQVLAEFDRGFPVSAVLIHDVAAARVDCWQLRDACAKIGDDVGKGGCVGHYILLVPSMMRSSHTGLLSR
ncbi:hypothetical protein JHX88_08775 [Paracoccus saliphilus]|uniref:Uncharacterized protein n=1 Tax=Paracoccus saliphilus TaxID=405559 RepID=A0ABY7SCL6_9RHOB|nr:hypothetical protein [Paracoccus saliphilus]WCR04787.1 hypothetical protein JHX88_08775 [Paracoccus saliphilus]